jgi:hypothetical protein
VLDQHRSHVGATCATVRQHLEEIRDLVTVGKSPAGGRVAPLPQSLRGPVVALLERVAADLDRVMRLAAPERPPASGDAADGAATRMWASILLRTAEELVADLDPDRMQRRYGKLEPGEAAALNRQMERVLAGLRETIALVDSLAVGPRSG